MTVVYSSSPNGRGYRPCFRAVERLFSIEINYSKPGLLVRVGMDSRVICLIRMWPFSDLWHELSDGGRAVPVPQVITQVI